MNTKRILVSLLVFASILLLASAVSATEITNKVLVEVNDVAVASYNGSVLTALDSVSVLAGETITVKVHVTSTLAEPRTSGVKIEANLEDVTARTESFDMEDGKTYVKTLTLKVPSELKDELSNDFPLSIKIWNSQYKSELESILLRVQRNSFDLDVKSISTSNTIEAGESFPIDIVLKNVGYNDLQDVYVTVKITELNIEKTSYFGDLAAIETDEDTDTVSGRFNLEVPYDVASGSYKLEVTIQNEDMEKTVSKQISIENGFPDIALKSGNNLILLNPTEQLKVYRVIYQTTENDVVVPAGSSRTMAIETGTNTGIDVFVFSGDKLLSTVKFSGTQSSTATSPVILLTIVLAIVFLVLLVVLVVLMTRKPQKTEEFGESYY